jgi:hypothetical protein
MRASIIKNTEHWHLELQSLGMYYCIVWYMVTNISKEPEDSYLQGKGKALFSPEYRGSRFLLTTGNHLPDYRHSHLRKLQS